MRILKSLDLNREWELYWKISNKNLNQRFKIFKSSYSKGSANNQKTQKFVPVLDENSIVKNVPNLSTKSLEDKIKSAKNFGEKGNPKEDSSKITIFKVLSKIPNIQKTLKEQYSFC